MNKEYATIQIHLGGIERVDIGAQNCSPQDLQLNVLKGHSLVKALSKLAELGFEPLAGAISHGEMHPGGASYTLILSREV